MAGVHNISVPAPYHQFFIFLQRTFFGAGVRPHTLFLSPTLRG